MDVSEPRTIPVRPTEEYPMEFLEEQFHKYVTFILEEKAIPKDIKKLFWAFSDKENALTNLSDIDIRNVINHLEIAFNYISMKKPDYQFKFDDMIVLAQIRTKLLIKLKRSKDGFERRMQATQIREIHAQQERETQAGFSKKAGGFFARIFGR